MTILRWIGGAVAVVVLASLAWLNMSAIGRIYLPAATGITAKQVCSLTFVSGLSPQRARELYVDPLLGDAAPLISASVDTGNRAVHSRVLGLWHNEAVYREGLGCTLMHGAREFDRDLSVPWTNEPVYFELDTAHRDTVFDSAALDAAIDGAFEDPNGLRNTLAVVVLHEGRLVAERYAPGLSRENRLHSWSMAKSVVATLAGAMTLDGQIDIHAEGEIGLLAGRGGEAESTTIDDLLRMTGGRAVHEYNDGTDPNSDMLFTESDMAAFSASRERLHPPGTHWEYMSGDTVLATAEMQSRLGDTLEAQVQAIRELVFAPVGAHSPVFEADVAGTLQGSSYIYATPQDWARLMQLYLDDGIANGERILPDNWRDYVTTPTPGSEGQYGSGFWLAPSLTPETFYMSGFQGQTTLAIPEHELIIVRMGATTLTGSGTFTLAQNVIDAMRETSTVAD